MRKEWTETTLGEIAEWFSGGTPKAGKPEFYEGGDIPWVVIADLMKTEIYETATCITAAGLSQIGGRLAPVGSVLISMYATVGRPGIAYVPVATNQAIAWSVPNPKLIESRFLLLVAQSLEVEISSMARGATQRNINRAMLKEFKFLLPPLIEQKRIVNVVSSVDAYIDALQQHADVARDARNAVLHELLSSGGIGWTETTLGEIGLTGLFADGDWVESKDQDPAGEYRLLQLADVGDSVFLDKSNRWMNSEQFSRLRCTPLIPRDILIARMPEPIARACIFPFGLPTCATVVDVAILRCGESYLPEFVVLVINDSVFRAEAQSLLTGTTRQRISRSNLAKIVCKLPSLTEQKRIVEIVSSMDDVIQSAEKAVEDAKSLRSGLLSDLLSGNHEIPASYDSLLGAA